MIRPFRCLYTFILLALTLGSASAQVMTGTPPLGAFGGGPDIIDLANLNAHIDVPVFHKAGRGLNFTYDLSNDTSVWYPVGGTGSQSWQPVYNWGWRSITEAGVGYVAATVTVVRTCKNQGGGITGYEFQASQWTYHDPFGITHPFLGTLLYNNGGCGSSSPGFTGTATDGSGYTITVTGAAKYTLYNALGTNVNAPYNAPVGAGSGTDRNGNEVSVTSTGTFTDTLGTTALSVAGSGTPTSPLTFTYTAPSGAAAAYTMSYKTYMVKTNFGCSQVADYGPISNSMVDRITLPDGTFYQFEYEATPGFTGDITGRLASITLPTGGTISYAYAGGSTGHINCADGSTSGFTRTTPDGTWTYTHVPGSGNLSNNTVTDPQGNETEYVFSGLYEISRQTFQGSTSGTLLETDVICYNGNFSNCIGATVTAPISSRWVYRYFPNLANPGISGTFYNSYGLLTGDIELDYVPNSDGAPFLTSTGFTYASLGNIVGLPQSITVTDNNGNTLSQVTNSYDQGTLTVTSGTPQHVAISGSRGNLTSTVSLVQGSATLTKTFTYYDTGNVQTATDVNGAAATYNYANATSTCGNAFPTSVSEPLSLSRSFTWNCTGGVQASTIDENNQTTSVGYLSAYFWRPGNIVDPTGAQTNFAYTGQNTIESTLSFNSGNSTVDKLTTLDGLGRFHIQQTRQAPSSSNFDSIETDYDSLGRPSRVTLAYVGTAGQTNSSAPAALTTYDALSRPLQITDAGGGSTTYSYPQNDVLVTIGPAPSGENTKRRQLEYDAIGRLTSVCEITGLTGSSTCGQNAAPPGAGYWTKYVYGPGNLLTVTQNAQAASGSQQTRSYSYDGIGRLTSETNPESGTTTYVYDTNSTCAITSNGDLIKKTDAAGVYTCVAYDALHRVTSTSYSNSALCKFFEYDSNPGVGFTEANVKGRMSNAWIGNCSNGNPNGADEGFNYSARGELINFYQVTSATLVWYDATATYWPNGSLNTLQLFSCLNSSGCTTGGPNEIAATPKITYGPDGEGRSSTVSASSGQNPVTSATYNAGSLPTAVALGSSDNDAFTYDPNTFRLTKYQFNINAQSYIGAVNWNANGTLGSLGITDPFNSADNQTCSYSHDDLIRIASVNCGAATWQQNFTYDPFGNITKTVPAGGTGNSFQPTYSAATNHISNVGGFTPTYDSDGDVTNDGINTYAWDARGNATTVDGVVLSYDALDLMIDQNRSGAHTQVIYTPTGEKFALMSGQTLQKAFFALPGGGIATYNSSGLLYYGHSDHLGSIRVASTPSRTISFGSAYAPFGETYATSGTTDPAFTGQRQDTSAGLYDFLNREYSTQGRWPNPDRAGRRAVSISNPQSWNRYAYVTNNPMRLVDPLGLDGDCSGQPISAIVRARRASRGGSRRNPRAADDGDCDLSSGGGDGGDGGGGGGGIGGPASTDPPLQLDPPISMDFGVSAADLSTSQDQALQELAPGIIQGAGGIGDPAFVAGFYVLSGAGAAAANAGALWEAGSALYEEGMAGLIEWQAGDLEGFNTTKDMLYNIVNSDIVPEGTSQGAVAGALAGCALFGDDPCPGLLRPLLP